MQFNILTMVYGSHHVSLFREACLRSLNWPKNREVIKDHEWHVYTKREHFVEIDEMFKDVPIKLGLMEIGEAMMVAGCGMVPTAKCDASIILLNGLRNELKICLKSGKRLLFAPPDTIFGDGSVANLISAGIGPGSVVFAAHPRVLPSIIDEIKYRAATSGGLSNARLVTLALEHSHDSWKYAELGHAKNNSFVGGICWQRTADPGIIEVRHRLPTPYFMSFTADDWNFWWGTVGFGALDHTWPGQCLIRQERMRYIGSSDAAFVVEITDHDKNVPQEIKVETTKGLAVDSYFNWALHNSINRQFLTYFRGE